MDLIAAPTLGADALTPPGDATADLRVEIHSDLSAAQACWRALEAAPEMVATPFQRYDWVRAFLGDEGAERVCILAVYDAREPATLPPLALLPLTVAREGGLRVARFAGRRHARYGMPLYRSPAAAMRLDAASLRRAARAAGIDALALGAQPVVWDGVPNPLARLGQPSPSDGYGLALDADAEATVRCAFSADARKKLRTKEKRLAALLGPVAHERVCEPSAVARVLYAFHAQKAARFAALGIADPFADPAMQAFLRRACCGGSLELHALLAGGRVLATYAGAVDAHRFSGMVNSFESDPEIARNSPGDVLLLHLVAEQAARGRRAFDLGVGEARYKASICDTVIALTDAFVPVSARGALYAAAMRGATRAKCAVKRDPRLWALVQRLRRMRGRVRSLSRRG